MTRRSPSPSRPPADRGLSPLVSLVVLLLVTGLAAAGVHVWLGSFPVEGATPEPPRGDVVFRSCSAQQNLVTVALHGEETLAFDALSVTLVNRTTGSTEITVEDIPQDGDWSQENPPQGSLLFGSRNLAEGGVPWGPNNTLASDGGLDSLAVYDLGFDHVPTDGRIDTVGFSCR